MWDSIAHNQLGDASLMDRVLELNRKHLDMFIFPAGVEILLPDIQASPADVLPPWKQVEG